MTEFEQVIMCELFLLHEFFHIQQGVDSNTVLLSDKQNSLFQVLDYDADAFAVEGCFYLVGNEGEDWTTMLSQILKAHIKGGDVFFLAEESRGDGAITGERLYRQLVWHFQYARACSFPPEKNFQDFNLRTWTDIQIIKKRGLTQKINLRDQNRIRPSALNNTIELFIYYSYKRRCVFNEKPYLDYLKKVIFHTDLVSTVELFRAFFDEHRDLIGRPPRHRDSEFVKSDTYRPIGRISELMPIEGTAQSVSNPGVLNPPQTTTLRGFLQIEELSGALSSAIEKEYKQIQELAREGKVMAAQQELEKLREGKEWNYYGTGLKGKILRYLAALRLGTSPGESETERLLNEADTIDPEGDSRYQYALLKAYRKGPKAALELVETPWDTRSFNLKLTMLLELGKIKEALVLSESQPDGISVDSETPRLQALAFLHDGQVAEARRTISAALRQNPTWFANRQVSAVIDFYSALSPHCIPSKPVPWPEPMGWHFVQQGEEPMKYLRRAETEFRELSLISEADRVPLQIWLLGSLSNQEDKQAEAEQLAQAIIVTNPAEIGAILWAQEREYHWESNLTEKALIAQIKQPEDGSVFLQSLATLANIRIKAKQPNRALRLVKSNQKRIVALLGWDGWRHWYGQLLAVAGNYLGALKEARQITHPGLATQVQIAALRKKCSKKQDPTELHEYLGQVFEKNRLPEHLLEYVQTAAVLQKWGTVVEHYCQLVDIFHNTNALYLAFAALWNTKQFKLAGDLLEASRTWFPDHKLPAELNRRLVFCREKSGEVVQAKKVAFDGWLEDPKDLLKTQVLIRTQWLTGNLPEAVPLVYDWLERDDIPPQSLLETSKLIQIEDPDLARALFRKAIAQAENNPSGLQGMIPLGYRLGLDEEIEWSVPRFLDQPGGAPDIIRFEPAEQVADQNKQRQQYILELEQGYRQGIIYVHYLPHACAIPLSRILIQIPEIQKKGVQPLNQKGTYIHSGASVPGEAPVEFTAESRLHIDLTALLMAEKLGLLDAVERRFKRIFVAPTIQAALHEECEQLLPHQQSYIDSARTVLTHYHSGKLMKMDLSVEGLPEEFAALTDHFEEEWLRLTVLAREAKGFLVENGPGGLSDSGKSSGVLPPELAEVVIGLLEVEDVLFRKGKISQQVRNQVLAFLGLSAEAVPVRTIELQSPLLLSPLVAQGMVRTGILEAVCQNFTAYLSQSETRNLEQLIANQTVAAGLIERYKRLRNRIHLGLKKGTYVTNEVRESSSEDAEVLDPYRQVYRDLLKTVPDPKNVFWVDDQHLQIVLKNRQIGFVGTVDILKVLFQFGDLEAGVYYGMLADLRQSNYRYLPLFEDELWYHLRAARAVDGQVFESLELRIIRQYFAACLVELSKPSRPVPHTSGQVGFVIQSHREILHLIGRVWGETADPYEAEAKAEWVWKNLYWALLPVIQAGDAISIAGLGLANLLIAGLFIQNAGSPNETNLYQRCKHYYQWFENRIWQPAAMWERDLVTVTAVRVARFLATHFPTSEEPTNESLSGGRLLGLFYQLFPQNLKRQVSLSQEMQTWLGVMNRSDFKIGPLSLSMEEFGQTLTRIAQDLPSQISNGETRYDIIPLKTSSEGQVSGIKLIDPQGNLIFRTTDPIFLLLGKDAAGRSVWLKAHRGWFDCDEAVFLHLHDQIVRESDPLEQFRKVETVRAGSIEFFYRRFAKMIEQKYPVPASNWIPDSVERWLYYFRISISDEPLDFEQLWEAAVSRLVSEEGIEKTLVRITGLPRQIPTICVAQLRDLPSDQRQSLLERLERKLQAPASRLHLADLALRAGTDTDWGLELAGSILHDLFDLTSNPDRWTAFHTVLETVHKLAQLTPALREQPVAVRLTLIWLHANQLANLCLEHLPEDGPYPFDTWLPGHSDIFNREAAIDSDVLCWHYFRPQSFVIWGSAALFGNLDPSIQEQLGLGELIRQAALGDSGEDEESAVFSLVSLIQDASRQTNVTGSFQGIDRMQLLKPYFSEFPLASFAEQASVMAESEWERLAAGEPSFDGLMGLVGLCLFVPEYPGLKDQLKRTAANLNLRDCYRADFLLARFALRFFATQCAVLEDGAVRKNLTQGFLDLFGLDSTNVVPPAPLDGKIAGNMIISPLEWLEIAIALCVTFENQPVTLARFSDLMGRALEIHPEWAEEIGPQILAWARTLPVSSLPGLWPVLRIIQATRDEPL